MNVVVSGSTDFDSMRSSHLAAGVRLRMGVEEWVRMMVMVMVRARVG